MKKLLCLFSASLLVLTSCSSNEDNSPTDNTVAVILPKTIKSTYPSSPADNSIETLTYNGNKIVNVKYEGVRVDYVYDGDLIVKETTYEIQNGKDVKAFEENYTYVDNKLTASTFLDFLNPSGQPFKKRSVYIYNADGTVKKESYSTNTATNIETKDAEISVNTYANRNLVKQVRTSLGSSPGYDSSDIFVYEYDSKNNPLKNILGLNLLQDYYVTVSVNNAVKRTHSFVSGSTSSVLSVYKTDYVYNDNGYPIKETHYTSDGTKVDYITEYTY